jgi:probable O-glycosylation ligase (exosortase A-associated)
MLKTVIMVLATSFGIFGSLATGPYIGVLVYYFFAVARPQGMWKDDLPPLDFGWSYWVAIGVMCSTVIGRLGLFNYPTYGPSRGAAPLRWNAIHLCLVVFAFWQVMSYVLSEDQNHAYVSFLEYVKIFVVFLLASYALTRVDHLWYLLVAITLATVYVAYEMNQIYFVFKRNDLWRIGFGGLDNNGAGLLIAMGIPLCYFLWEATRSKIRWVYLLFIPVIGHAVMLSFSRGALLSVLLVAPMIFVFSRNKIWVAAVYVAGAIFVVATSGPELQERFFSISKHDSDESAQSRLKTWAMAVKLANDKPLFGYGIRCSQLHTEAINGVKNQAIHNTYLQMAADSGWPGMGLYIGLIGGSMLMAGLVWWRTRKWPMVPTVLRARAVAVMVITSLSIYAIGATFLSLETSEMSYILALIGAQLWSIHKAGGIEAVARQELPAIPQPRPMFRPMPAGLPSQQPQASIG